ncbi:CheR family methyltransferase [Paenibacillus mucilaginosus]|uniref:CheR-type protein glutamate methyltransferase n=3 Tax=Paenibacillus mucilaginosus TaxID=61624 RepID=H6NKH5_9BACL|nr:protein-glutamate O-methyltransferase CheR [Paenibacillus mucilaginosus]AEI44570.1 CheR-type protein glutamate methyltransferase [Paenibacillus mucilaginosus KNP414]AFC32366.1 CheR-type protein glutamate methyltransferase [Paenibacillus mucilaginosus 3016]AFH64673.1 chemotaxis protein R [Paenibacillus mucilaginosus K02]MCG7215513.1 protein-glutamate O-methyltransferase CheR [Paenibacillus mucilaginosus]WDM26145.1 protein-glutamate O-methyltransferase CheR [Paenibacillus mucilaginosus]
MDAKEAEKIEIDLLLEAIYRRYGYDFRGYARSSLMRRLHHIRQKAGAGRIADLIPRVLQDEEFLRRFLLDMSVTVTEMFRDPEFFYELRTKVIPVLKTYPFVKIWHAGCATGEEVYSMAILLQEEGFYDRVQIYGTDMNAESLVTAQEGIYPQENIRKFTANYLKSGGRASFSDYYHAKYGMAKMNEGLKKNIVFTQHNLVTDESFGQMHLILCRNVLIYFDRNLQDKVLGLFGRSLGHRGFLCLGSKESLDFADNGDQFEPLVPKWRIFRKQLPEL